MSKSRRKEFYSFTNESFLENAIKFAVPTEKIYWELEKKLFLIAEQNGTFKIEDPLNDKELFLFNDVEDLMEAIKKILSNNFSEYSTEFSNEPLGFVYYLGNQLLFSSSVEVLQKIYNKERNDLGNLYYSLVIKFHKEKYHFWTW